MLLLQNIPIFTVKKIKEASRIIRLASFRRKNLFFVTASVHCACAAIASAGGFSRPSVTDKLYDYKYDYCDEHCGYCRRRKILR